MVREPYHAQAWLPAPHKCNRDDDEKRYTARGLFARASRGRRVRVVRRYAAEAPQNVVQRRVQYGILEQPLVVARAADRETPGQVSLPAVRTRSREASDAANPFHRHCVPLGDARMAQSAENGPAGSQSPRTVPRAARNDQLRAPSRQPGDAVRRLPPRTYRRGSPQR